MVRLDVRFVKDGVARALWALRTATSLEPGDRVVPLLAHMIQCTCYGVAGSTSTKMDLPALHVRVSARSVTVLAKPEIRF